MSYFRIILLSTLVVISASLNAQASDLTKEEFLAKAQHLAEKYGSRIISQEQNTGCNSIAIIPDDDGKPFAVLKSGKVRAAEPLIYEYAEEVGLSGTVAPSYAVYNFKVKSKDKDHLGTVEAFIPAIPRGHDRSTIPTEMLAFIDKYKDPQDALTLVRFLKMCKSEEDRQFLFRNMSKESLDKVFMLYILMHLADMNTRNTLITLNANRQFDVKVIDTESCFCNAPAYQTCVLGFPQAGEPITDSVRALIPTIVAKMPLFTNRIRKIRAYQNCKEDDQGGYEQQYQRMQTLDSFMKQFPQASPRALMVFAFWNTFAVAYVEKATLANVNLSNLSSGGYGYYGLEKETAFENKLWSLTSYGFSSVSEGISRYHEKKGTRRASFIDMLKTLSDTVDNKKKPSLTDLLSLLDPHVLDVASYSLNANSTQLPFVWTKGFSEEVGHVWSSGKKSTISVPLIQEAGRIKSITFRDTHALISAKRKQVLFVSLNGEQVGEYHYTNDSPSHNVEIQFPAHLTGTAKIRFDMPFACRPGKLDERNIDPRKLAISFHSADVMFYKLHSPTNALLLNEVGIDQYQLGMQEEGVPFPFPMQGFSEPENGHRWTNGNKVTIKLPIMQARGHIKSLILKDTAAFLPEAHEQMVVAFLNGASVSEYRYTSATPMHTIEIPVPTQLIGDAEITFDIPFTRQPAGDPRDLGILAHLVDLVYYKNAASS